MKLYYSQALSPRKVCAVARFLDLPMEYVHVDFLRSEQKSAPFLAKNPNGKVPVLEHGDRVLWESNAIMCYLASLAGSNLWPTDARQFEVMRWLFWDANHFTRHASRLYVEFVVKPIFMNDPNPDPREVQDALKFFRVYAALLDAHLKGRRFVLGDELTLADFALGVTLPFAEKAQIPLEEFPELSRWYARMEELPAWRQPFPAAAS